MRIALTRTSLALLTMGALIVMSVSASAGDITSSFADGVLTVNGTASADSIDVDCFGGIKVNGADPDTGALACNALVNLKVSGDAGNDTVTIFLDDVGSPSLTSVVIRGGDGADSLTGGKFGDVLKGGAGKDTLMGDDGDDSLNGGSGIDSCNGGPGVDTKKNCEKT